MKKIDAASAAQEGGGGEGENDRLQYQKRDKDWNENTTNQDGPPLKSRECHAAVDNFSRTSKA